MAKSVQQLLFSLFLFFNLATTISGLQFITGACTSDAACQSGCCGFNSGKCAGAIVAQERDGGCGFGNPTPNAIAASSLGFKGQTPTAGASNAVNAPAVVTSTAAAAAATSSNGPGNKAGKQFITGPCTSDADCAQSCCGFKSGKCAGPVVAQERDGGCGFGDPQPNDTAAKKVQGQARGMSWEK